MSDKISAGRRRLLATSLMMIQPAGLFTIRAASAQSRFRVLIDGRPPLGSHGGDTDEEGRGRVTEQRLYQLVRQQAPIRDRLFEIEFVDSGVEAFAFTFG